MVKRVIKIILVAIVILGMVVPFLYIGAAEIPPEKNDALEEINSIVNSLNEIRSSHALSSSEKIREEVRMRKEALAKIAALLLSEMDELQTQIDALPNSFERTEKIQSQFAEFFDSARAYIRQFNTTLSEELTLVETKERAAAFKAWRDTYYQPHVEMLINFVLVSDTQSILSTADHRLENIIADLKRLESARITRRSEYNALLNEAMESLTDASLSYYKAKKIIFDAMNSGFIGSGTASSSPLLTTTHIKSLIGQSLGNIRSAYTSFLDISSFIKKRIRK